MSGSYQSRPAKPAVVQFLETGNSKRRTVEYCQNGELLIESDQYQRTVGDCEGRAKTWNRRRCRFWKNRPTALAAFY